VSRNPAARRQRLSSLSIVARNTDLMFEVERKFTLQSCDAERIRGDDSFLACGTKTIVDEYYDNRSLTLTTKDTWLRHRGENWELKVPAMVDASGITQYQEICGVAGVAEHLSVNLDSEDLFSLALDRQGFQVFAEIRTTREMFRKQGLEIVLDSTDFGYCVGEVEILVSRREDIDAAADKILKFLKVHGLTDSDICSEPAGHTKQAAGKVDTYLRTYRPDHYQALVTAGVVKQ